MNGWHFDGTLLRVEMLILKIIKVYIAEALLVQRQCSTAKASTRSAMLTQVHIASIWCPDNGADLGGTQPMSAYVESVVRRALDY